MIRKKLLLMFIGLMLFACTAESPESKQVKEVIMQYNALLAEGYKKMNMNPLQLVATEAVATKAYYHMAALGEAKVRMTSTLKDVIFNEVKFPNTDMANVTTRETWDFIHNDIKTGKTVLEEKGYTYEITYDLKKDGGQWKINNLSAKGAERNNLSKTAYPDSKQSSAGNGAAPPTDKK
jgi:hypothetical protein